MKQRKWSWTVLWSTVVSSQAHIYNTSTKKEIFRGAEDKQKAKTAILAPPVGPLGLAWCQRLWAGSWLLCSCGPMQPVTLRKLLEHKATWASPCHLALGAVQHCQAAGSSLYFPLLTHTEGSWTSRKAFPRLPFLTSPSHSHHRGEVWVLPDSAEGSENLFPAFRWTAVKFICQAEHSPPRC